MADTHKAEALRAIQQAMSLLAGTEPLDWLRQFQLKAVLEYAAAEVAEIQELKRARRAPTEPTP